MLVHLTFSLVPFQIKRAGYQSLNTSPFPTTCRGINQQQHEHPEALVTDISEEHLGRKLHGNKICCDKGRSPGDSFRAQWNLLFRLVYIPFSKRGMYLSVYLKATSSCRIAI